MSAAESEASEPPNCRMALRHGGEDVDVVSTEPRTLQSRPNLAQMSAWRRARLDGPEPRPDIATETHAVNYST